MTRPVDNLGKSVDKPTKLGKTRIFVLLIDILSPPYMGVVSKKPPDKLCCIQDKIFILSLPFSSTPQEWRKASVMKANLPP
jgi:hypothetical protein